MREENAGIDSFSYYHVLTSGQKSNIMERLQKLPGFHTVTSNYAGNTYAYLSDCFADQGVKVWVCRKTGKLWGLLIVVHPTLVLGGSDRSALYQPRKKEEYRGMVKKVDKFLKTINVPCSVDNMTLYRVDMTTNLIFEEGMLVDEYMRILKKSCLLPHYQPDWFQAEEHKTKDCKIANKHSFKQYCKSAAFFAYDKTAQLEMIDAFPSALIGKRVLRLEAQLRRRGMKKWVGKDAMEGNNWNILKKLWKSCIKINQWYINRLQAMGVQYVRYEDAVRRVETIRGKKTKEWMLYLLRKTSDSDSLTAGLKKMGEKYDLTKGQQRTILKKFEKLKISPITLKNSSLCEYLPSIQSLL